MICLDLVLTAVGRQRLGWQLPPFQLQPQLFFHRRISTKDQNITFAPTFTSQNSKIQFLESASVRKFQLYHMPSSFQLYHMPSSILNPWSYVFNPHSSILGPQSYFFALPRRFLPLGNPTLPPADFHPCPALLQNALPRTSPGISNGGAEGP